MEPSLKEEEAVSSLWELGQWRRIIGVAQSSSSPRSFLPSSWELVLSLWPRGLDVWKIETTSGNLERAINSQRAQGFDCPQPAGRKSQVEGPPLFGWRELSENLGTGGRQGLRGTQLHSRPLDKHLLGPGSGERAREDSAKGAGSFPAGGLDVLPVTHSLLVLLDGPDAGPWLDRRSH